jgi:hypothetical protein
VIQKFLDTPHLPLLKQYMEKVAEDPSVMRPAYAAVLLTLYVHLRDGESLRAFIDKSITDKGYKWDVDEAISTCMNGVHAFLLLFGFLMFQRSCYSELASILRLAWLVHNAWNPCMSVTAFRTAGRHMLCRCREGAMLHG